MGGTDDPSNLIELTPAEHAEAHRMLYEQHGCWQDYVAWQGLSKLNDNFDAAKETIRNGGKTGAAISNAQWKDPILKAERISKFKKSMEGKWPIGRKGELNPSSKAFIITYPDGKEECIVSLKMWCDKMGLKYNTIFNVCVGRGKTFNGYTIKRAPPSEAH